MEVFFGVLFLLICLWFIITVERALTTIATAVCKISVRMGDLEKKLDEIRHELEKIEQK